MEKCVSLSAGSLHRAAAVTVSLNFDDLVAAARRKNKHRRLIKRLATREKKNTVSGHSPVSAELCECRGQRLKGEGRIG